MSIKYINIECNIESDKYSLTSDISDQAYIAAILRRAANDGVRADKFVNDMRELHNKLSGYITANDIEGTTPDAYKVTQAMINFSNDFEDKMKLMANEPKEGNAYNLVSYFNDILGRLLNRI